MPPINMIQAINQGLREALRRDEDVVIFGEDVGKKGGVFLATDGLWQDFGEERVFDTPLSECGIVGTAIGMAMYGLKPIPEIQFSDFIYPAFDQIVSEAAKMRYRSGGQYTVPMVIRSPSGGGIKGGHYHSQSPEAYFCHTPGLKVAIPSTPYDAKGMLLAAIEDPDPVLFFEPKILYRSTKQEVPEGYYTVPLGTVRNVRAGEDCTILAYGAMVRIAEEAADQLAADGITCEIVDIRTLAPLDEEGVLSAVKKTGRCVVVYEAPKSCGFGAELSALVAERAIEYLEAPILRVAGFDTPFPYSLEHYYMPNAGRVARAVRKACEF